MRKPRLALAIVAAVVCVAVLTIAVSYRVVLGRLKERLPAALGPRAVVERVEVDGLGITLYGLRVPSAPPWPTPDELRASSVRIKIPLADLLKDSPSISSIDFEDAYVSLVRRPGGGVEALPGSRQRSPSTDKAEPVRNLGTIRLLNANVEIFDASGTSKQPKVIRLGAVQAQAGPVVVPGFKQAMQFSAKGIVKGPQHDGRFTADGDIDVSARSGHMKAAFIGVDLLAVKGYLARLSEGGVKGGSLDLTFDAAVAQGRLHGAGKLTLSRIETASADSLGAAIAGAPHQAMLAVLSRDGRIALPFTLKGQLDQPEVSVDENLSAKAAAGVFNVLGVSIGGIVEGVGSAVGGVLKR